MLISCRLKAGDATRVKMISRQSIDASTKENEVLLTRRQTKFLYFVDVVSKDSKLFQVIRKTLNTLCHLINTNLHKSDSGMVPVLPVKMG